MNSQEFGKFISTLRKEKGLTQVELAERINVSDKAISRWENGKNYPDIEILEDLGKELGVSISELIACKRIVAQENAEIETIKAFLNEVEKGKRNKKIFVIIVSVILIVCILVSTAVGIKLKSNQAFAEKKVGIVSSDIVASLYNIDAAISCDDYYVYLFDVVCNGKKEIETMNIDGCCSDMHEHYSQILTQNAKVDYCKVYESKEKLKEYRDAVDIKTIMCLLKNLNIADIDRNYNENNRYSINLVDISIRNDTVSNDTSYILKNDILVKMKKNDKLIGNYAAFDVFKLNQNSIAQIYVSLGSADVLDVLYGYFNEMEQGNISGASEFCTDGFVESYVHKNNIFGIKKSKMLYIYDISYNMTAEEWVVCVCQSDEPTKNSAYYDNGKRVETMFSYIFLKDNGKWKIDRVTTD